MEGYMTVKEVLSEFRIGKTKLYEMFKNGLKKHKFKGTTLVKVEEIKKQISEQSCIN